MRASITILICDAQHSSTQKDDVNAYPDCHLFCVLQESSLWWVSLYWVSLYWVSFCWMSFMIYKSLIFHPSIKMGVTFFQQENILPNTVSSTAITLTNLCC